MSYSALGYYAISTLWKLLDWRFVTMKRIRTENK